MTIPLAPADNSGGFMVISYSNGTDTHRMRVHVLPFDTHRFIIGGGTPSVTVDDGNHDYAYTPDRPAGQEAGITDTFAGFCNALKGLIHTSFTLKLAALYQIQSGQAVEVFPVPVATPVAGTNAGAAGTLQARALQVSYNFKTYGGRRARLGFIGGSYFGGLVAPVDVTHNSGGNGAPDQTFVGYCVGAATAIVGHDGQKLQEPARITVKVNDRLRRHYGYA